MNVLFLTHRLPYAPNRGDRIRGYFLLKEMSRFAKVSLFSLVHDNDEASHLSAMPFASRVEAAKVRRVANLARGVTTLASSRPLTHTLLNGAGAKAAISRLVAERPPDVVVALCSGMARFALEAPLRGRPFVLDMIDVDSEKWRQMAQGSTGPKAWIYRREARTLAAFEAAAVSKAKMTLVVNEREREALLALVPGGRIETVQNGIDLDAFRPTGLSPDPPPNVVFCGVLSYEPNAEGVRWFAKEVWPLVRAQRRDATFTVIGSGTTQEIRDLGVVDPSIRVAGTVPSVQPYLWGSAVAIAPLRIARGVQNKVLEALAAGLPTVVTQAVFEGLPQEARLGCLAADSPVDFAEAVSRLLSITPGDRRRIAAEADLSSLTWDRNLARIQPILESASGAPRHPIG